VSPDLVAYVLMTSALRLALIDIGDDPFVRVYGLRPGRDVVQRGRHKCYARTNARATARYRRGPPGSRAANGNSREYQTNSRRHERSVR
jgi:hypothetical protein